MTLRQRYNDALAKINDLQAQLDAAKSDLAACQLARTTDANTIASLRTKVTDLQAQLGAANARIAELEAQQNPTPTPTSTHVLGAWTEIGGDGVWSLAENQQFDTLSGAKMAGSMHYATWTDNGIQVELTSAYNAGRTLTHTAWPAWKGGWPADAIDGLISGKYDSVIQAMANKLEAARQGRAMQWRPFWEMNGSWMPWNAAKTANDPGKFVAMYRRVVTVGRAAGYRGTFVWSPNSYSSTRDAWNALDAYWPGDDVVDIVGASLYNGFTANGVPWREFKEVAGGITAVAVAHDKPLMMSEGSSIEDGAAPGRKAQWIRNMFAYLQQTPRWETILWFHRPATSAEAKDYRVNSSTTSLDAWREVVKGSWPQPPLTSP